jgi:hypothetical protein
MTRRRNQRSRRRAANAVARGDEPPDPISATIAAAVIGAGATLGSTAIAGRNQRKAAAMAAKSSKPAASPLAGESTQLKPGQVTNLKNTGPQGLLTPATTGRSTLLGG